VKKAGHGGEGAGALISDRNRNILFALVVFSAALSARLVYLAGISESPYYDIRYMKGTDAFNFFAWALSIASGKTAPEGVYTFQTPLYPYFLAAVFKLSGGGNLLTPRLVQALIGSGTAVIAYFTGRFIKNDTAGLAAGLFVAFYGPLVFYDGAFLRDAPMVFFYAAFVYSLMRLRKSAGVFWSLVSGGLFSISLFLKPNILLMLPVWGWSTWKGASRPGLPGRPSRLARLTIWWAAGFLLLSAPVAFLNFKRGGPLFSLGASGAFTLVTANHPTAAPTDTEIKEASLPNRVNPEVKSFARQTEGELLPTALALAGLYRDHPSRLGLVVLHKAWTLFYGYETPENLNYYVERRYAGPLGLAWLSWSVLLGLALPGMAAARRGRALEAYAFLLIYSAGLLIYFVVARYRLPLVPALAAFWGTGLVSLIDNIKQRRRAPAAAMILAALLIGILSRPVVTDPLRPQDYHNLARFHAIRGEPEAARRVVEEGLAKAGEVISEAGGPKALYRKAFILYLSGAPLEQVEGLLQRGQAMDPPAWLSLKLRNLEMSCLARRETSDLLVQGFRFQ